MKIRAYIRRVSDGEVRIYESDEAPDDLWLLEHMWSDGNYGCDCNRELFFERAGGVELEVLSTECSEGRYIVDQIVDEFGRMLYHDGS